MALFRYKALNDMGKKVVGVIDADSLALAQERLLREQVMVTDLTLLEKKEDKIVLSPPLLLNFTRELSQLLRAGLPLYESLLTIEEKYRRHRTHPLFLDLCDKLKSGSSLSHILKKYPKSFDAIYLSLVHAGEKSGSLPQIFDQLTLLISRQQRLKKQLISSLTYPGILFGFCMIVVASLLFFVVPSLQELFDGRNVHPLTRTVLAISKWVNANTLLLFSALTALVVGPMVFLRMPNGRLLLQRFLLKVPIFKTLLLDSALIRFCRSCSLLLAGGVPLIEALTLARKTMKLVELEQAIESAEKKIVEGERLSQQLKRSPLIPPVVIRMLSIAEETGTMGHMLQKIAEIYDEELEKNLAQLTTFLQPALLLTLGAIVGLVVLSILLPLTDVSSFMNN